MRYIVVFDYCFWSIDTLIEDGEVCNVDDAWTRIEAETKCKKWNENDLQ